jgi:hypothetical protein
MKLFYTVLDERMDADIDTIIAKLEEAKKTRTYLQRARAVAEVARACQEYEFYWDDKLQSLMD